MRGVEVGGQSKGSEWRERTRRRRGEEYGRGREGGVRETA